MDPSKSCTGPYQHFGTTFLVVENPSPAWHFANLCSSLINLGDLSAWQQKKLFLMVKKSISKSLINIKKKIYKLQLIHPLEMVPYQNVVPTFQKN